MTTVHETISLLTSLGGALILNHDKTFCCIFNITVKIIHVAIYSRALHTYDVT